MEEIGTGSRLGSQMHSRPNCIDAYITGPVRALCEHKSKISRKGFGRLLLGFIRRVKGQVGCGKTEKYVLEGVTVS